jgi:hypothetical protein
VVTDPTVLYHALIPHPALSPVPDPADPSTVVEQAENEAAYRQLLAQGLLAVLLPAEELENACERTMVADILADLILGTAVGGKACAGWVIWEGIGKTAEHLHAQIEPTATGQEMERDTRSRLERFGLLTEKEEGRPTSCRPGRRSMASATAWWVLQYGYLVAVAVRFLLLGLVTASSRPRRSRPAAGRPPPASPMAAAGDAPTPKRPILSYRLFSAASLLLDLPARTPWLHGTLCLLHHHLVRRPRRLAATDGLIDK